MEAQEGEFKMFSQKLRTEPQKAKRRHTPAFYVIGLFTFAIESMLGVNAAFLVWQSVSIVARNMLSDTPLESFAAFITLIISLAVGFCFVMGGMWTFSGYLDSYKDAKAYEDHHGTRVWPRFIVVSLALLVLGIDFSTLMFRASYFGEKGAGALLAFFILLIPAPFALGLLMYVLENTPRDRRLAKVRSFAEQLDTDHIEQVVTTMDPDLRTRLLNGDADAIQEHYERVEAAHEEAEALERARVEEKNARKQEKHHRQTNANRPLEVGSQASPLELVSLPQQAEQRNRKNA